MAKNNEIIEAALTCFAKYGIKRTTMADIAATAEVSRQTVYAHFGTKEEIIHEAIVTLTQRYLTEVEALLVGVRSLEEQLDAFFEAAIFKPFDSMQTYPDLADLLNSSTVPCKLAFAKATELKCTFFQGVFAPYEKLLHTKGQTVEQFAQFVTICASQCKQSATSRQQLDELIASLRAMILCCLHCKTDHSHRA